MNSATYNIVLLSKKFENSFLTPGLDQVHINFVKIDFDIILIGPGTVL